MIENYFEAKNSTIFFEYKLNLEKMVPRTRFELVISALRGRRVRPLHQRGFLAAHPGFEPGLSDSESDVLPLD